MRHGYTPREDLSKSFFGNKYRIDVAAFIMHFSVEPPETFRGSEVAREIFHDKGIGEHATYQQLKALGSMNMIEEVELVSRARSDSSYYYRRTNSPLWRVVEVAVEAMDELFPNG